MEYDHRIDEIVLSTLEDKEKAGFNELLREIKDRYKQVTQRRLSIHLQRLEKEGFIFRKSQPTKYQNQGGSIELVNGQLIGVHRYCFLTEAAKFERKLRIFEGVVSKREERSKRGKQNDKEESQLQKRRKLLLLVLLLGNTGATRSRPKSKAELGDIGLYDEKERRLVPHELYTVPGFGVSDFLDEKNKRFLGQAGALSYVKFSKAELEEFFETLVTLESPMIKVIDEIDTEKRYGLEDRILGEFLSDCWYLFFLVKYGLDAQWRYGRQRTGKEYEWYRYFYGNEAARHYFNELFMERKSLPTREELFRSVGFAHLNSKKRKEEFSRYGKEMKDYYFNAARRLVILINSKYEDIIERYSSIAKPLIKQICSPLPY